MNFTNTAILCRGITFSCGRPKCYERLPEMRCLQSPRGALLPELSECFVADGSTGVPLLWGDFAPNCALLQELWSGAFRWNCAYCSQCLPALWRVGAGERSLLSQLPISSGCTDSAHCACRPALFSLWHGNASWRALLSHLQPPAGIRDAASQSSTVGAARPFWHWRFATSHGLG